MLLNKNDALKAMRAGQTIGFANIPNIRMYTSNGYFWFERKGHKVEKLDQRVLDEDTIYVILENKNGGFRITR